MPADAPRAPVSDPVEAIARGLLFEAAGEVEARLMCGEPIGAVQRAIILERGAGWRARHGSAVADRAAVLMLELGSYAWLTPQGLASWAPAPSRGKRRRFPWWAAGVLAVLALLAALAQPAHATGAPPSRQSQPHPLSWESVSRSVCSGG